MNNYIHIAIQEYKPNGICRLDMQIFGKSITTDHRIVDAMFDELHYRYRLNRSMICEKTRRHEIVKIRQIACFLLRRYTKLSLQSIGDIFGAQDHTSIMHSIEVVTERMEVDADYKKEVEYFYGRF